MTGGGSTITQQVIKQSYFPDAERTYTRKLS
ncbi:transglycosylase domain-containing protein [Coprobacillaceae bacterium CR2/5/TPMF4]|nr:transglycosylase domain-containing protein [Coprobacillaceae bacterium CR2/5/TPMF4]